jgi:hypothetical protein
VIFRWRISIQLIGFGNFGVLDPSQESREAKTHFTEIRRLEYGSPVPSDQIFANNHRPPLVAIGRPSGLSP